DQILSCLQMTLARKNWRERGAVDADWGVDACQVCRRGHEVGQVGAVVAHGTGCDRAIPIGHLGHVNATFENLKLPSTKDSIGGEEIARRVIFRARAVIGCENYQRVV